MRRGDTFSVGVAVLPYACALSTPARFFSTSRKLQSFTTMKIANAYEDQKYSSKDIPMGPRTGVGFDPVAAKHASDEIMGPLKRRMLTTPEDFLSPEESRIWMSAADAAKLLDIKEAELPVLSREKLEEKWVTAYRVTKNANREEVMAAAEVLLEYLDSSTYHKKSRQYYRTLLERTRVSIDIELGRQRSRNWELTMYGIAISFTVGCLTVLAVMYLQHFITRRDLDMVGSYASDYIKMTFMSPNNVEPAPDYNTRYFHTPTAAAIDERDGVSGLAYERSDHLRIHKERDAYLRQEEAEMVRMFNDAADAAAEDKRLSASEASRVSVFRPEDFTADGTLLSEEARTAAPPSTHFGEMDYRQFSGMMAKNFGGGSRLQRMTSEPVARAAVLQEIAERTASPSALPPSSVR